MVMKRQAGKRGFTLLEILVALAILGIVMISAVKTSGSATKNAAYLKERTLAHWVAMNRATDLQVDRAWVKPGSSDGVVIMANREWRWQETAAETADKDLRRVEIKVQGDSDGPLASLVVYIGNPVNRGWGGDEE